MYTAALFVLLVAATHGMMAPCCPPKEWQAVLIDLKSQTALQYATLYAYDGNRKVEGSLTIPTGGSTPVYQTFTDYNTNIMYSVSMVGDPSTHKCEQKKADHDFYDNCFSGSLTNKISYQYIGNSTFGALTGGIPFDAWDMQIDGVNVTIALSQDKCAPLIELVQGKLGSTNYDALMLFNDFSETITTKELVTMPAACVNVAKPVIG